MLISRDSRPAQGFAPLLCPKTCFPSKIVADFARFKGRHKVSRHFYVPKPVFQAKSLLILRDSRSAQGFAPLLCPKTCFPSKKSLLILRDSRSAQGFAPLLCPKTCFPSKKSLLILRDSRSAQGFE